jgi:hypothetical protein
MYDWLESKHITIRGLNRNFFKRSSKFWSTGKICKRRAS